MISQLLYTLTSLHVLVVFVFVVVAAMIIIIIMTNNNNRSSSHNINNGYFQALFFLRAHSLVIHKAVSAEH